MARFHEKSKFIECLREIPLVSPACKKFGIARASYYRWYKSDIKFKQDADEALKMGKENINDLAEYTIIKKVKEGDILASKYWLQHNNPKYAQSRAQGSGTIIKRTLQDGEECKHCGQVQGESNEMIKALLTNGLPPEHAKKYE